MDAASGKQIWSNGASGEQLNLAHVIAPAGYMFVKEDALYVYNDANEGLRTSRGKWRKPARISQMMSRCSWMSSGRPGCMET